MTSFIVPFVIMAILVTGMRKTLVYEDFIDGVSNGIKTVVGIFPAILAILTATAMLRESGAFELLVGILSPLTDALGIPQEIMPLALLRPMSGGASLGMLTDILNSYPPDSDISIIASVLMAASETTFYTLCVYFKNTRVKYTKKIIPAAIIGDIVGLISAVWVCKIIF